MSEKKYMEKEEARMALVVAMEDYRRAFEAYDDDEEQMVSELEDALDEAGFVGLNVIDTGLEL